MVGLAGVLADLQRQLCPILAKLYGGGTSTGSPAGTLNLGAGMGASMPNEDRAQARDPSVSPLLPFDYGRLVELSGIAETALEAASSWYDLRGRHLHQVPILGKDKT
jgi:hypothetical protein